MKNFIVYKYTNLFNGLIYIGLTSVGLEQRWHTGYYQNQRLCNDIKRYGKKGFKREILFESCNRNEAMAKEEELICSLNATNPQIGYNVRNVSTMGMYGKKHSEETKRKFSENRTGSQNSFYGKHHTNQNEWNDSHAVICLNTMKVYGTIEEAKKQTGITSIESCINGSQLSAGKDQNGNKIYWCTYHGEDFNYQDKLEQMKLEEQKAPRTSKPVQCIETGEIFLSALQAGRAMGDGKYISGVSRCCRGERKTAYGYHWRFITDENILSQIQRKYGTKDARNLLKKN